LGRRGRRERGGVGEGKKRAMRKEKRRIRKEEEEEEREEEEKWMAKCILFFYNSYCNIFPLT